MGLGQLLVNESSQLRFAHGTHFGGSQLAVFEDHECGNAANAKLCGNIAVFINVHLGNLKFSLVGSGNFVQYGCDHFAGATPFRPKVDDDGLGRLHHVCVKSSVRGVFDQIAGHGLFLVEIECAAKFSKLTSAILTETQKSRKPIRVGASCLLTFMNPTSLSQLEPFDLGVAVVGGGPAGLMAAEILSGLGHSVHLFDAMPSVGRKFLLAGRGGLNLTHSEENARFVRRYGAHQPHLEPILSEWGADSLRQWAEALGTETFVGTSGRVFPKEMKAAPLLRAWLYRLKHPEAGSAVQFHMRHRLLGIKPVNSSLENPSDLPMRGLHLSFEVKDLRSAVNRFRSVRAKAVILALGGGSWAKLGSDGQWVPWLRAAGIPINPLQSSNCGFHVAGRSGEGWTPFFQDKFAGQALKTVIMHWTNLKGELCRQQGEFVASRYGVEGSLIYAASADLRDSLNARQFAEFKLDLLPDRSLEQVLHEVKHPRGSRSLSSHLKGRLGLEGVKMGLLNELLSPETLQNPADLALAIKALPIKVTKPRPMDEAISTAGGVQWQGLDPALQTQALPGLFCAGEMLDWEAPTGGYLLTACMSTGVYAAKGADAFLKGDEP